MVSILSFDSKSIKHILSEDNKEFFRCKNYPLFYKNRVRKGRRIHGKYLYRSAIENALRDREMSAVDSIIKYVVKYQNDFVSSWLFEGLIPELLEA